MGLDEEATPPQWIFKAAAALCALFAGLAVALAMVAKTPAPDVVPALSLDRPQLVVFESASCSWCVRFRKNVAPAYEASPLERRAPLTYVDISQQKASGYRLDGRITATPTFILVDRGGREVARIRGLPGGKEAFLPEVEKMLGKLPGGDSG
jgi:hypothetical protein